MDRGAGEKPGALRAVWLRLTGRVASEDAAANLEDAQRTLLVALDGGERAVNRIMRRAAAEDARTMAPRPVATPHAGRYEALCDRIRQDIARARRPPERSEAMRPGDGAASGVLAREAMAEVDVLERELKKLEKQCEQLGTNAAEWERRAMLAVKAGVDDLARDALQRSREADQVGRSLRRQLDIGRRVAAELRAAVVTTAGTNTPSSQEPRGS